MVSVSCIGPQLPQGLIAGNTAAMARQSRQARMPSFLLTRPEARASRFAAQLRARFGPQAGIVTSPLLFPRLLAAPLPAERCSAIIFTSETGVDGFRHLSAEQGLLAFCVGDRTAAAAQAAGFVAQSAGADAMALVETISRATPGGPLIHARGRDTTGDLAVRLASLGYRVHEMVVYEQIATPLSPEAARLLSGDGPVIAPVFSPRSAALLAADAAVQARHAPLWLATLSPTVAAACAAAQAERTACAARPDADALLDAVAALLTVTAQP
jgi:uroporphyrinogen-III synthase